MKKSQNFYYSFTCRTLGSCSLSNLRYKEVSCTTFKTLATTEKREELEEFQKLKQSKSRKRWFKKLNQRFVLQKMIRVTKELKSKILAFV